MSKNPKQVFGGYKSALTRKMTSAKTYAQQQDRVYSNRVEAKIDSMIEEIRDQKSRWETKFLNDIVDALDVADVTGFQNTLENECDTCHLIFFLSKDK